MNLKNNCENKIFLEDLPKTNSGKIDWKNSINRKVRFLYDEIFDTIDILEYIPGREPRVVIKNNEKEITITTGNLKRCKLGRILERYSGEFKFDIGHIFKNNKNKFIILEREYVKHKNGTKYKYYKCKCIKCNYINLVEESKIKNRVVGCPCCSNKVSVLGINTIWDTDRWMVDLGVSEEDAKRYVSQSNKYIEVCCPNCGKNVKKRICKIYNYKSIGCSCGDGISYPEKFMNDVLNQLNVEFQSQLTKTTFEWCGDKRYDFYIPEYNMIIETHGRQHYTDNTNFKMSLKEVQENDRLKENLAKENGIKNYIVINCRESDLEYIKNSILNSKLNDIFDLSQINWNKCEEFALKNIVKEVCDYWNDREDWETTGTIINNNKWGIKDRSCLIDYLKKGNRLNWCVYDPKYEKSKSSSKNGKLFAKQVEVFKDNVSLGIFESTSEFSRRSKDEFGVYISVSSISNVCSGRYQSCKGFSFRYII